MKNITFWFIIFVALAVTNTLTLIENQQLKQRPTQDPLFIESQLATKSYELSYVGKKLSWPEKMDILGEKQVDSTYEGYGIVFALDELSCDVCRDEQTQFALDLAREVDPNLLRIVVSSKNKMYARSYMRLNGIDGAVFFDKSREFFDRNNLGDTPVLLFHNPQGEIISAHFPTPGHPELSKPFHNFCRNFFGLPLS
jgi:hypothetical protein